MQLGFYSVVAYDLSETAARSADLHEQMIFFNKTLIFLL